MNEHKQKINRDVYERLNYMQKDMSDQKAMIGQNEMNIKELRDSLGADFLKKFDQLQAKSKNTHDLDELIKKIEALNKFVKSESFNEYKQKTEDQIKGVSKLKESLDNYVDQHSFKEYKS